MDIKEVLKSISNDELLRRTLDHLARSRTLEWELVAHINEIDERRLYRREGSPSMIQYCMDVLHLSEGQAYRRITAARTSREFPVIVDMLKDGRIHLCGVSALSKHLTRDNHEDVLARATHKSKRYIEELARELDPKPDVEPSIRKRPQRKAKSAPAPPSAEASSELFPGRVDRAPQMATPRHRTSGLRSSRSRRHVTKSSSPQAWSSVTSSSDSRQSCGAISPRSSTRR